MPTQSPPQGGFCASGGIFSRIAYTAWSVPALCGGRLHSHRHLCWSFGPAHRIMRKRYKIKERNFGSAFLFCKRFAIKRTASREKFCAHMLKSIRGRRRAERKVIFQQKNTPVLFSMCAQNFSRDAANLFYILFFKIFFAQKNF